MEEPPDNLGIHYLRKMSKKQFRACMGLLGLESNAFLSDRIFEVVDSDKDEHINFAQFATIMDTLLNGDEDEKHEFSFALFDVSDCGYFGFDEFKEIITKFIAHFCIITGSHSKVDSDVLREIFDRMDHNKDGIVDVEDYKIALKGNPGLF
jgi:Ca2+-binding EF-hand superfamily protein